MAKCAGTIARGRNVLELVNQFQDIDMRSEWLLFVKWPRQVPQNFCTSPGRLVYME